MKKIIPICCLFLLSACDQGFEDINTNPAAATDIPAEFLFTNALLGGALNVYQASGASLAYASCFVQHLTSTKFNWQGDKYFNDPFHSQALFVDAYTHEVKSIVQLLDLVRDQPAQQNLRAMARIWKTVIFHRLTDLYGDIPYSEAGLGYVENIFDPVYDTQEAIYTDMLEELEEACLALDETLPNPGAADILYKGSVAQWRKFGYSMMLRLAMRLTKVNPEAAKNWSKKAMDGGIMEDDLHAALIPRATGPADFSKNGVSFFTATEDYGRVCKTLVNWLQAHEDPRLPVFAWQKLGNDWLGQPHGLDDLMIITYKGGQNLDSFARIHPLLLQLDDPTVIMSAAEPQLLAAEVCLRGWSEKEASAFYAAAIRANMKMWVRFDASFTIADEQIDDYLAANPLPADPAEAIRFINEQYWAATFLNHLEAFANWRRSGFPALVPSNFPGNATGGTIPRRLKYPQREYSVNSSSIQAAIQRQGADEMTTRVWWDKE